MSLVRAYAGTFNELEPRANSEFSDRGVMRESNEQCTDV